MRDWLAFFLFDQWWVPDRVHYWARGRIEGWFAP